MSNGDQVWHGPRPLDNRLDVARLSEIYSGTAAFYDGVVAEKQARAKVVAIELLDRRPGERFLEVGVGTAWAFQRIVAASGAASTAGLDIAAGMLDVARDALEAAGVSAAPLLLGDGRRLPFANGGLDCILNTYTFEVMRLPDIAAMLAEMLRVLRHGGRAVVVNLTDATDGGAADEAMVRTWKARYEADPESFGGARPLELTAMLQAAGFDVLTRRYVGPEWPSEVLLVVKEGTGTREQE